jgi:imidazolonepropionase-like amidohydrolase
LFKVHDQLSRETYFAVIDEAKRQRLPVEGHVPPSITAAVASRAGQKSIEHLTGVTDTSAFADFVANRTWQCPTLVMRHHYALLNDQSFASDPRLKYVKPSWRSRWLRMTKEAASWPAEESAKRKETIRKEDALVGAMQRAGIGILAGTDDANPYVMVGFSLHDELELLVGSGLTPTEALQTATRNPGRFLDLNAGTIESGALADLVLLDRNPLESIGNTRAIRAVIANGRFYDRRALDQLLDMIARAASENRLMSTGLR